ncbi:ABC transporter ATP-binding protein [Clostridium oryzae]|uniref:Daunorubicin/doxorubicin resistance ATP-binding protein DrrA n=1 Tax=Clostridium oryzae TaxID=1450648 RepID=A0A1V4IQT7_9CLOT|nr:ABC transporter ATP-binding protein [Clostridium oryzae]OPJ62239.1 daunorubicin/doxorubicin resistance ATP-binding protein DrrA [Clostridium oryzae]
MEIVKINNLTKKYKDFIALDNISLNIKEGEIYGLLGPNGAGKSTTINMICGLISITKGEIAILGKNSVKEANFTKKNIGVVPQDIAIYEDLTCIENVKFFASLYGLRGSVLEKSAKEALEFVGLLDKAKALPDSFSGGMKRRLNIACAIAHTPKLIIMDEPTVGIDPQSRNHILQAVKKLNEDGCTIIYTSHYMEEIEHICTRIGIIDHGKLIAEGSKEELKSIVTDKNTVFITASNVEDVNEEDILKISGVIGVDINENTVKIDSQKDINNFDKLVLYFTENNIRINNLENKVPDLETVFLTLTGRKLRD